MGQILNQLMKRMDPRQLNLLLFVVLLLSSSALASYVVWPKVDVFLNLSNTLKVLQNVLTQGNSVDHEVTALQQKVELLNHRLRGDTVNMSSNQLEAFIIGRMQDISWQHSVELRAVTPGSGNQIQIFEEVLFSVEVTGDYFDLFGWLTAVREELGMLVIKQFTITSIEHNTTEPRLLVILTIAFYREMNDA